MSTPKRKKPIEAPKWNDRQVPATGTLPRYLSSLLGPSMEATFKEYHANK